MPCAPARTSRPDDCGPRPHECGAYVRAALVASQWCAHTWLGMADARAQHCFLTHGIHTSWDRRNTEGVARAAQTSCANKTSRTAIARTAIASAAEACTSDPIFGNKPKS